MTRQADHQRKSRAMGLCDQARSHGKAYKGGRCRACYQAKLEAQRRAGARVIRCGRCGVPGHNARSCAHGERT